MFRPNNRFRPARHGRRPFGWLPLVLAVVALVAIFGGRGDHRHRAVPFDPPSSAGQVERGDVRSWDAERGEWQNRHDGGYEWSQQRHMPMMFAPFFIVGKLLKLLLALGLIGAGLFVLRRDRRPRRRGPEGPDDGPGTPLGPVFHA